MDQRVTRTAHARFWPEPKARRPILTAIVTGGTRGLGRAISLALHAEGHQVAAVYRGNDAAAAAPGYCDTDMVVAVRSDVLGRLGHPEDVARMVAFLARDDSDFTGATFSLNGGPYLL